MRGAECLRAVAREFAGRTSSRRLPASEPSAINPAMSCCTRSSVWARFVSAEEAREFAVVMSRASCEMREPEARIDDETDDRERDTDRL